MAHMYDVKQFGAVGAGVSDDTGKIQAAQTAGGGAYLLFQVLFYYLYTKVYTRKMLAHIQLLDAPTTYNTGCEFNSNYDNINK